MSDRDEMQTRRIGRKPRYGDEATVRLQVCLPPEMKRHLEMVAARRNYEMAVEGSAGEKWTASQVAVEYLWQPCGLDEHRKDA